MRLHTTKSVVILFLCLDLLLLLLLLLMLLLLLLLPPPLLLLLLLLLLLPLPSRSPLFTAIRRLSLPVHLLLVLVPLTLDVTTLPTLFALFGLWMMPVLLLWRILALGVIWRTFSSGPFRLCVIANARALGIRSPQQCVIYVLLVLGCKGAVAVGL